MHRFAAPLAAVTIVLAACTPAAPSATPGGPAAPVGEQRDEQQILRVGAGGFIANPTPQASSTFHYQYWPLYDNLTQYGPNFEVRPSVAEKWEVMPDGTTWRFSLRKDVTWPDGSALTADDVVFTIQTIMDRNWPQRALFASTTAARALDQWTVEWTTNRKDGTVPLGGQYLWIIPKKYFEQVGFDGFVNKPVGSGPYELLEFRNVDIIRYKKRPQAHAFRRPIPEEIVIRLIPENTQAIAGLRTGEIDIAPQRNFSGDQAEQLKSAGLDVRSYMALSMGGVFHSGTAESKQTPLRDRRVRQAMIYAIDRESIAKNIYKGYALAQGQASTPGALYWDPDVGPWRYDPALSKRLLAEAGYASGFKLAGGVDYTTSQIPQEVVVAVQGYWREIGIDVELRPSETGVYTDKAYGRNNQSPGDFLLGTSSDTNGIPSRTFLGCGKPIGGGPNSLWWCSAEWDRLLDEAQAESDPAKRVVILRQANRVQREDAHSLNLLAAPSFLVTTTKVRGLDPPMPFQFNFDSTYKVK